MTKFIAYSNALRMSLVPILAITLALVSAPQASAGLLDDILKDTKEAFEKTSDYIKEQSSEEPKKESDTGSAVVESKAEVPSQPIKPVADAPRFDKPWIEEVQSRLTTLGYSPGPVDGAFGGSTERAIKEFQKSEGLPVDGQPRPSVIQALRAAQANSTNQPNQITQSPQSTVAKENGTVASDAKSSSAERELKRYISAAESLGQLDAQLTGCKHHRPGFRTKFWKLVRKNYPSYEKPTIKVYDQSYLTMVNTLGQSSGNCHNAKVVRLENSVQKIFYSLEPKGSNPNHANHANKAGTSSSCKPARPSTITSCQRFFEHSVEKLGTPNVVDDPSIPHQCINLCPWQGSPLTPPKSPDMISWEEAQQKLTANGRPINYANMRQTLPADLANALTQEGETFVSQCEFQTSYAEQHDCSCLKPIYLDERSQAKFSKFGTGRQQNTIINKIRYQCFVRSGAVQYFFRNCMMRLSLNLGSRFTTKEEYCACAGEDYAVRYGAAMDEGKRDVDRYLTSDLSVKAYGACR